MKKKAVPEETKVTIIRECIHLSKKKTFFDSYFAHNS